MLCLALETSCDDTAVALVRNGVEVVHTKTVSQIQNHAEWGGVVPEIAARLHAERWSSAVQACITEAGVHTQDIDFIAVTQGPGLQTSLLVGCTAAMIMSQQWHKPLVPVHHVHGHIISCVLGRSWDEVPLPALVLTVSGGHTQMHIMHSWTDITLIGQTLDDAAGEAYDKVAKMLGLGYPGGPLVERISRDYKGDLYSLPSMLLKKHSLDFSFSGLKASVYRAIELQDSITDDFVQQICTSVQRRMESIFSTKLHWALMQYPAVRSVHFVGGVSANTGIRTALQTTTSNHNIPFFTPTEFLYCTDNAAMIGAAAHALVMKHGLERYKPQPIEPISRWSLVDSLS